MAKTTPVKPKKNAKTPPTGPVLVEEPPESAAEPAEPTEQDFQEDEEQESEESEEQSAAAEQSGPPDPRRVPPSSYVDGPTFWKFLLQHPAPQDLDLYVYRLFPVIRVGVPADWTSRQKPPTYIEKVKGLITPQTGKIADQEWLRDVRGSGTYDVRIADRSLKRTQNRQVCQAKVEINEWNARPPILNDWSELVPNIQANQWIISRLLQEGIIKRTPEGGFVGAQKEAPAATAATPNGDPVVLMRETLNAAERMAKLMTPAKPETKDESPFEKIDIVKLIQGSQSANDPGKVLSAAKELAGMMKPAETSMDTVLKIVELLKPKETAVAAVDPITQMKNTAEMFKTMKEAIGPSETEVATQSRMNGWQEFLKEPLTEMVNLLKPLATVGAQVLMMKASQGNQQQQRPAPAPAPTTPAVTAPASTTTTPAPAQQPGPQPEPANPQQPQQTATSEPPAEMITPEQQQTQAEARAILTGLAYVMPTLTDYLADKDLGGEAFAAWFCDCTLPTGIPILPKVPGFQAHQMIKKYSAENVVALVKGNSPAEMTAELIGAAGEKEEAFLEFIKQFQSYDPNQQEVEQPKGKKK